MKKILYLLLAALPLLSLTSCDDDENVIATGGFNDLEWGQGLFNGKIYALDDADNYISTPPEGTPGYGDGMVSLTAKSDIKKTSGLKFNLDGDLLNKGEINLADPKIKNMGFDFTFWKQDEGMEWNYTMWTDSDGKVYHYGDLGQKCEGSLFKEGTLKADYDKSTGTATITMNARLYGGEAVGFKLKQKVTH